ncbi:MAG: type II secretion system protein GspL [Porticoccaceae bacterium]|jgi:type II secretion system protein L|nr:type II secretion system protein GspL [Porticoccaceae bacterium]MDG1310758.1 type II secretion system protein GspL [Porticoccaceae bacterium]
MSLSVDHIHSLDRRITNEGDALGAIAAGNAMPMQLWVPTERIGFHLVDEPTAPERKWLQLIPWLLEDRILQPVEEMHFVIAGRSEGNQLQVLAVSREDMQHWRRVAENSAVAATTMVPDFLALPWEAGRINVGWREGTILVRNGADQGFAASPDIAWAMIDRLINSAEIAPRLSISIPDESLVPKYLLQFADINDSSIDWSFTDIPVIPNLLQGDFKSSSTQANQASWLPAAGLAVLALVMLFSYLQISSNRLNNQVQLLEKQLVSGYSKLFGTSNINAANVRDSAEQHLSVLFKQQQSLHTGAVAGLTALDSLMTACDCDLRALKADSNNLTITIDSGSKLKTQALNIDGYQTSITPQPNQTAESIVLSLKPSRAGGQ